MCVRYNRAGSCEYHVEQDRRKWKFDSTHVDYLELKLDILEQLVGELTRSDPEKASRILAKLPQLKTSLATVEEAIRQSTHAEQLVHGIADDQAISELASTKWTVREDADGTTNYYGPVSGRGQVNESVEEEDEAGITSGGFNFILGIPEFRLSLLDHFRRGFGQFFLISSMSCDEIASWNYPSEDISKQLLMCSVFAYGAMYDNNTELAFSLVHDAEILALEASKMANEHVLHALLILSCFELGMGLDSNSWALNAMSAALAQSFSLHSLPDTASKRDLALFWSVILQDRIITSVLGRGCRIQYFRVRTPSLPFTLVDGHEASDSIEECSFSAHSKLWFIHDRFLGQIYSNKADFLHSSHRLMLINQGLEDLKQMQKDLPRCVVLTPEQTDPRVLTLHLSFSVTYLLLHRAYLKQIPFKVIQAIVDQCETSADLISRLQPSFDKKEVPYFASYLVLTCATFDLFLLTNRENKEHQTRQAQSRMAIYVTALSSISTIWRRGMKDIQVLGELSKKWSVNVPSLTDSLRSMSEMSSFTASPVADTLDGFGRLDTFFQEIPPLNEDIQ